MNPLTPLVRAIEFLGSTFNLSEKNTAALRRAVKVAVFTGIYAAVVAFGQEAVGLESPLKEIIGLLATLLAAAIEKHQRS